MLDRSGRLSLVIAAAVLAMSSASTAGMARADMMSACASDIASLCSDVSRGRGRISACLFADMSRLSAACRPEVEAVARKGESSRLVPAGVRALMGSGTAPAVPAACSADVAGFCSGVDAGDRNTLACLYARTDRVSNACSAAVRSALDG